MNSSTERARFTAAGMFQRGCGGGPALGQWRPAHHERIVSFHPSRVLRERRNGRATTKTPTGETNELVPDQPGE